MSSLLLHVAAKESVSSLEQLEGRLLFAAQAYTWQNVNIGGGGFISGIEFSPVQANLAYARTDVGGAYRYNGSTWTPLNDNFTSADAQQLGVLSIAPDPANANKVYELTGQYTASWAQNASFLASSDQGATWTRTVLPFKAGGNEDGRDTGERLAVDPNLTSTLFIGSNNNGLWKSTNGGTSWSQVTSFTPTSITFVLIDKRTGSSGVASKNIYVGVNNASGPNLYRSTDGGTTWQDISSPATGMIPNHAAIDFNQNYLYVTYSNAIGPDGVTSGSVWKYNMTTRTWPSAALSLPTGQGGYAGVSVDPQHAGTLMVSTLDRWYPKDEVYRSTDGGTTWTSLIDSATLDYSKAPWATGFTPSWISDVAIDPFNSSHAMFNSGSGLYDSANVANSNNSTNATATWTFNNSGINEVVPTDLIAPQSGPQLVSTIYDFDGFTNTTAHTQASRLSPHMGKNTSIDFAQNVPTRMVRVGNTAPYAYYSFNSGSTWTAFPGATPSELTGSNPTTAGTIAMSYNGNTAVWTPDKAKTYYATYNGTTWSGWTASTGAPTSTTASFAPVADRKNASKFYIYDQTAGKVYVSTNSGVSFAAAATGLPTGGDPLTAVPNLEGDLWLPAGAGGLYHSTNSGTSFSQDTTVTEADRIAFGKAATGQTYPAIYLAGIVGGVSGVFRSDDSGATWTEITDTSHKFGYISVLAADPNIYGRIYIGTGGRGIIYGDPASLKPIVDGVYTIANRSSNLDLEDPSGNLNNSIQMVQDTPNGAADQQWDFEYEGNGFYKITNVASGLVLDDPASNNTPGTVLQQYAWNGGNNQLWSMVADGTYFVIKNKATGLVVDDPGYNPNPNVGQDLYTQNGGSNQDWLLTLIQ